MQNLGSVLKRRINITGGERRVPMVLLGGHWRRGSGGGGGRCVNRRTTDLFFERGRPGNSMPSTARHARR
ncbi:hypothetical protein HanXRQr2_Chr16g0743541 [Helianthus annuus]|uniref:Uncharacterized protein n=1 Tax=Helianthus annuus TaxID=4232 RepID=A0A9K3DQ82_HELAN|nr:hypothetical protein HanXRQr2_Chr16g0743541 [Helianthus annuus]